MPELQHDFDPNAVSSGADRNLDIALDLARAGAFVFPCQSSGANKKQPCKNVFWRSASTSDESKIRRLWERHPGAVPGIDLAKLKLLVIDCDQKPRDGLAWLAAHAARFQDDLAAPPAVDTPSGGRHLYYRNTFEPPHTNARGALPPKKECGIDVRGHGGFVIAPGAVFADGSGEYFGHGSIFDAAPPPQWLIELLTPPAPMAPIFSAIAPVSDTQLASYGEAALAEEFANLAAKQPGERNEEANRIAFRMGQLIGGGALTFQSAYGALQSAVLSWGVRANDKALGPRGTLARALAAGEKSPRGPAPAGPAVVNSRQIIRTQQGDVADAETGEVLDEKKKSPGAILDHLTFARGVDWTRPFGLLADLTDWILLSSRRPNRPLAVAAATATLSALCGRHLYGPTGTALNLYIIGVAGTATGKNRPYSAVAELCRAAKLEQLHTTIKGFSVSAIERLIEDHPCCVATADEIGASLLSKMSHLKANTHELAMRGALLELWSREQGMGPFATHRRATADATLIPNPSLSIFGMSTAEAFYESVTAGSVKDGFLNRFLLAHAAPRSKPQDVSEDARSVPAELAERLLALIPVPVGNFARTATIFSRNVDISGDRIPWDCDETRLAAEEFEEAILLLGDVNQDASALMGRIFEYAVRLAALHAVSRSGRIAGVSLPDLKWGAAWAIESARGMIDGAMSLMAMNDYEKKFNAVRNAISAAGALTKQELARGVRQVNARERKDIIEHLLEGGWIERRSIKTSVRAAEGYRWIG